jgi:phenylpyruvate tautomerase PptA (4-oxalocrotonate tautomerase family)
MPLVHITLLKGRPEAELQAIGQAVHASLVDVYDMDDRDRFQVIHEVEPGRLIFSRDYAGGPRSNGFMVISITSMPRQAEKKEAFYKSLVRNLDRAAGVRSEDVFVCLSDHLALDDISFAGGISAAELAKRHAHHR